MNFVKNLVIGIYVVVCGAIVILAMIQTKEGASETIVGGNSSNFYEKNKGKTREGMMKRWTIILTAVFALLTIGLGIIYVIPNKDGNNIDAENYVNEAMDNEIEAGGDVETE